MSNVDYIQVPRQTWEERFQMYMKCTKKELASMMAERDKYMCPEACKEFEPKLPDESIVTTYSSDETIS